MVQLAKSLLELYRKKSDLSELVKECNNFGKSKALVSLAKNFFVSKKKVLSYFQVLVSTKSTVQLSKHLINQIRQAATDENVKASKLFRLTIDFLLPNNETWTKTNFKKLNATHKAEITAVHG
jgi:hypothetical protein